MVFVWTGYENLLLNVCIHGTGVPSILYYSLMLSVRQIGTKSTVTQFWTKSLQKMNKWIAACWWKWSHHGEGKWMAFNWPHSYYQLFTLSHNMNLWYYTVLDLYHFIVWMLYLVFPGNSTQWSAFMCKSELKKRQIYYFLKITVQTFFLTAAGE